MFGINFLYEKISQALLGSAQVPQEEISSSVTVGCVETITAGALSNALCSKPGASRTFMGGIIAYSVPSKKTMLDIDTQYSESHEFANNFTTSEMVRSAAVKIPARIILGTTGFSLPYVSETMQIDTPYAIIALYDKLADYEIMHRVELPYDAGRDAAEQRAENQVRTAYAAIELFGTYTAGLQKRAASPH